MTPHITSETELTPKQKEVLTLLQAGKTNKDIASALGIRAGTVKQHLVTIFRKLGVKNRTHAALQPANFPVETVDFRDLALTNDIITTHTINTIHLERRPCVTLIMTISEDTDDDTLQHLQQHLERCIKPYHAVVIGRKTHQREVIFGLDKTEPLQAVYALDTALRIAQAWQIKFPKHPNALCAHLCHTLIIASMDETDQWTEEMLMSVDLGKARQAIQQVAQGKLNVSANIRQQLLTQGILLTPYQNMADFDEWQLDIATSCASHLSSQAHTHALTQLQKSLDNRYEHNAIALLIAHEGLGKSQVLLNLYQQINQQKPHTAYYFRFLPEGITDWLTDKVSAGGTEKLLTELNNQSSIKTLLLDDVHLLSEQARNSLLYFIEQSGYQAVFTSTHPLSFKTLRNIEQISLHPLSVSEMRQASAVFNYQTQSQLSLADQESAITLAQGNPALLQALLTTPKGQVPLSVILSIMSRIDALGIQRSMLRHLLLSKTQPSQSSANTALKHTLALALRTGILEEKESNHVVFHSPLVERILKTLLLVQPEVEQTHSV